MSRVRRFAPFVSCLALVALCRMSGATTPEEAFETPPRAAHAGVWWHWMGGQVTAEGILRDLDWFQRNGIFSATVFGMADSCTPWAKRIADVPSFGLRPYDERWWRLFALACREGRARGIDIGLHNCPGYTSTGGPWIPSRLAMRELVFNVTNAAEQVSAKPTARYPVYDEKSKQFGFPPCAARLDDIVEIGIARGGVRVAHVPMGAFVQPADWGTFGLECDKMNPDAVNFHLDHVLGELKRHLGEDLPSAGLKHVLLDSYEAGTPSWTPRMRSEFLQRRGYDPLEFLPIVGGYTNLYSEAEVEKFRKDFDQTIRDLYRDVLFKIMSERLHAEGLDFSNEPYEGPFDAKEVSPFIDRIMTEFWYSPKGSSLFKDSHRFFSQLIGPCGLRHNVIEAEAFTGRPEDCRFTEMPANLKPSADDAFLSGVNRLVLHSSVLQPWGDDAKPGVTMGRWGVHFGRNQTWADCARAWFDYLARCQALLQWGDPSDVRLPEADLAQLARTDGKRTIWFVVNKSGKDRALPRKGRWFDPVSGAVACPLGTLIPGASGFWEPEGAPVVGKCASSEDSGSVVRALTDFSPALGDRTKSEDPEVRYYSGTLTYRTTFGFTDDEWSGMVDSSLKLSIPEGADQVFVLRVNKRPLGCAWCRPYAFNIPNAALKQRDNEVEIDVTNAWHNRLVGDEQEPPDCEFAPAPFGPGEYLVKYPDWFVNGMAARPSKGRRCFVTWNYFGRDDALVPSGLLGAPRLTWRRK